MLYEVQDANESAKREPGVASKRTVIETYFFHRLVYDVLEFLLVISLFQFRIDL